MSQPTTPAAATAAETRPEVEYTQEVRFAVVMYGGSSLAIYMNGVAQELLRLVRATAPQLAGGRAHLSAEELEGSERVYRKLGQLLARGEATPSTAGGVGDGDALQTRFVIDVLTGTSAGGINAVYLAKALANDQSMDELKRLWVTEGDIGVLLNDRASDKGVGLGGQKPPRALLNGRRMYLKLLQALRGMDDPRPGPGGARAQRGAARDGAERESPLVNELDLFVTATDMLGRVIPLRLADGVAHERRHRSVFRFRYFTRAVGGEHRNDFRAAFNPFLAFAARSTSAHQAAFEVMRFDDIAPVLADKALTPEETPAEYGIRSDDLKQFYEEYLPRPGERGDNSGGAAEAGEPGKWTPFEQRSFSDGGVLDNSPFSFASDALPFRHADAPVDRKLIYIEPSPEHPELDAESAARPDFFSNALMALTTLPRYQTIVEDLVRVLERNRLIERVNHIMLGLEDDLKWRREHGGHKAPPSMRELLEDPRRLREWAGEKRRDISWGGYERLRVADLTDDLTLLVALAAGFDEESDEFTAVRYLVRHWRAENYEADPDSAKRLEVEFLMRFDMVWLMRRVRFVLQKVNELSCFDERARQVFEAAHAGDAQGLWDKGSRREAREALTAIKRRVARAYTGLSVGRARLWSRGERNVFRPFVAALGVSSADLVELLKQPTDKARQDHTKGLLGQPLGEEARAHLRAAAGLLDEGEERARLAGLLGEHGGVATRGDAVRALTEKVRQELQRLVNRARARCRKALDPARRPGHAARRRGAAPNRFDAVLRDTLWYYYRHFDEYDLVSYPILHATGVGEELDPVEVFRISPEDATFLVDEKKERVHKLAGTTLGHFGAFFEERFRRNDIMWGRLDAAERVIRALLPNDAHNELRAELTAEAHRAIIAEETVERLLAPKDKAELRRLVSEALRDGRADDGARLAAELAERLKGVGIDPSLKSYLRSFLEREDPLDKFRRDFKENYEAERAFTPRETVVNAGRASRILGRMIDGIAAERRRGGSRLALWAVRLTSWVWGLAMVAVPGSAAHLFGLHLLRVLYFIEVSLIALGVVLAWKEMQRLGLVGLFITGALHAFILFVGDFVLGGPAGGKDAKAKLWRWGKLILRLGLVVAVVGALGFVLFKLNSAWMPWLLDNLIRLLDGWYKGLTGRSLLG